jgi:hypothetical protein
MLALHPELVELANAGAELADQLSAAGAAEIHLERFVSSIVAAVRAAPDELDV